MANIEDLFWQVRAELPGVPFPLLYLHYANAVREHLSRSLAWQHDVPNLLDLDAGDVFPTIVDTASLDIPEGSYIVQPVRVKWSDGCDLVFKTRDQLDDILGDWESKTGSRPDYWTITSPGTWRVVPLLADDEEDAIRLRVALSIVVTTAEVTSTVPDYLANEYQAHWACGAKSNLMAVSGKDWTNLNLASAYGEMFEGYIKDAKSRAAADYGRPSRSVRYGGLSLGGSGSTLRRNDYGN